MGNVLIADLEKLETIRLEMYSKTHCARGDNFPNKEFIFPIAIKFSSGGDQELRTSTLIRHRPIQGKRFGESEGPLPQPHDSLPVFR